MPCMKDHFVSLITEQNRFDNLVCPNHDCKSTATDQELKAIVGEEVFKKYISFNRNQMVA
jgi:hypothetical protein